MKDTAAKRKWTVMICLAGDNNLSSEMIYNIKELKRVKLPDTITVIALFDPAKGLPTQGYVINPVDEDEQLIHEADWIGVVSEPEQEPENQEKQTQKQPPKIAIIPAKGSPNIDVEALTTSGIKLNSVNTGDPQMLSQIIKMYLNKYQAEHYLLVLSGHGSGAEQNFFLTDDSANDSLNISELNEVITSVAKFLTETQGNRKIDILGLDSCLMSMAEVYYQLGNVPPSKSGEENSTQTRSLVDFIVGSEGFVRNSGWPYQRVLSSLAEDADILPQTLAKKIVEIYIAYYSDYALAGQSVEIAACDLRGDNCIRLRDAVENLGRILTNKLQSKKSNNIKDAVLLAHWEAQSYKSDQYTDLFDFCDLLAKRCRKQKEIKTACKAVKTLIKQSIVKKSCYVGPDAQYSFGLSIYFPWSRVSWAYQTLRFCEDTQWHNFLKVYVKETRRVPRKEYVPGKTGKDVFEDRIYNYDPVESDMLLGKPASDENKFVDPINKFVDPINMAVNNKAVSMKNPPVRWGTWNCTKKE